MSLMQLDPVHVDPDNTWWFWIETWTDREGPFKTEEEARQKLADYSRWLDESK